MSIKSIFTKFSTAIVTCSVGIFRLAWLFLLGSSSWSWWSFFNITFIFPNFIGSIKYLFRFTFDFFANLQQRKNNPMPGSLHIPMHPISHYEEQRFQIQRMKIISETIEEMVSLFLSRDNINIHFVQK